IVSATSAQYEAVAISPTASSVTTEIVDASTTTPPPGIPGTPDSPDAGTTLSITGDTSVIEGDLATYKVQVTNAVEADMVVQVQVTNVTTNGDVVLQTIPVTILAGQTESAPFTISNVEDTVKENTESYKLSIISNTNGGFEAVTLGTTSVETFINDDDHIPEALNGVITMQEDTTYTYTLADFKYSDADNDPITAIRIDSLPVMGDLYYNGTLVTATGLEINAANIGLLTFKPDLHDSGSDEYIDNIGNSTSVGEQSASYGQFDFSVNDGTNWSAASGTMTIDVNAVADAPTLSVSASQIVTEQITVDSVHLTNAGFVVNAYNAYDPSSTNNTSSTLGSLGIISTYGTYGSTAVNGFGVAGAASGADAEVGYNSTLGTAETIVISFDETVSSVDMALSWNAAGEDVAIAFYNNGVLIETVRTGGGTDGNELEVTYKPSSNAVFDEMRLYPPDAGDDFLIHSISFERNISSGSQAVVNEGEDISLNITSALVDTDGSEALTLLLKDIPAGAIISDGTHTFTATATTTSTEITDWNLNALTFNMPNIDAATVTYTLHIQATSTEYSNGDNASVELPLEITVQDRNYVSLSDNLAQVDEADILNIGTNHSLTLETATGNILSDDTLSVGSSLTSINGVTAINGIITVTTAEGNTLVVNADVNSANYGDYTYTLNNAVDHPSAGNDAVAETFIYTVTAANGATSSANLVVTIVDDTPVAAPQTIDLVVEPITTNIVFILDISGSMDNTELQLEADARDYLISQYKEFGHVNVMQTQFESNAITTPWMDSNNLYGTPLRTDGNMTDYEAALNSVMSNYDINRPAADQTIIYFISDGAITEGSTTNWNASWATFVAQDSITKLFTYGIGTSGTDLNAVALPNEDIKSPDPITVTSITQLQNVVSDTVQIYTEGSLVKDTSGNSIIDFGADAEGAHIASIEINNNTVNYDSNNITQTISGLHGDFVINFDTGAYRYIARDYTQYTEALKASIVDGDGDTLNTVLLNINVSVSAELRTFDGGIHFEDYNIGTSTSSNSYGWTNAGIENQTLFIDNGKTASKTFAVHANETVSFSFDAQTQDNWESGDKFTIKDANGTVLYEHSDDYTGAINFTATANATGAIQLNIFVSTNSNSEELHLDNLVITREYSTDAAFNQTTGIFTLTDEVSVDFDQLAKQIDNLQKIDLSDADKQKVSLSLDDVLDMTSSTSNHTLVIAGDSADTLQIDKTGWTAGAVTTNTTDGSTTTYEYTKGTDSVSLIVDENIPTTVI
ncbi:VWA domain-containing protein, partial [bacterium]|nr:VWA domain-containing protein [bacterium]MBU1434149.1 VWA domain-containing protein [bacterium]